MKLITIVGARPQFIKAAVLSRILRRPASAVEEILVHTGQHFDPRMSDVFFREMEIPKPGHHLGINSGNHGEMTGAMLGAIEEVLLQEKPDRVLVYGDTNSTLAGGLAAAKLHIPVAHVEAGLRSFDRRMPEEVNRVLTDHVSSLLFCPSSLSVKNLEREGITEGVHQVGDIMLDACRYYAEKALPTLELQNWVQKNPEFCFATVHRAENTDDPAKLRAIVSALRSLSGRTPVFFPVHPRTQKALASNAQSTDPIFMSPPLSYFETLYLLKHCRLVLTDSGGLQKEAYFFDKPCVVFRETSEWTELLETGTHKLAGAEEGRIKSAAQALLNQASSSPLRDIYGNGRAGERIAELLHASA